MIYTRRVYVQCLVEAHGMIVQPTSDKKRRRRKKNSKKGHDSHTVSCSENPLLATNSERNMNALQKMMRKGGSSAAASRRVTFKAIKNITDMVMARCQSGEMTNSCCTSCLRKA
eukprot:scpid40884/ scgid26364/ 